MSLIIVLSEDEADALTRICAALWYKIPGISFEDVCLVRTSLDTARKNKAMDLARGVAILQEAYEHAQQKAQEEYMNDPD